jgi:hypothetical protein
MFDSPRIFGRLDPTSPPGTQGIRGVYCSIAGQQQGSGTVRRPRLGPASPLPRPDQGAGRGKGDQRVHEEDDTPGACSTN